MEYKFTGVVRGLLSASSPPSRNTSVSLPSWAQCAADHASVKRPTRNLAVPQNLLHALVLCVARLLPLSCLLFSLYGFAQLRLRAQQINDAQA